jgi:hypothetical protein
MNTIDSAFRKKLFKGMEFIFDHVDIRVTEKYLPIFMNLYQMFMEISNK